MTTLSSCSQRGIFAAKVILKIAQGVTTLCHRPNKGDGGSRVICFWPHTVFLLDKYKPMAYYQNCSLVMFLVSFSFYRCVSTTIDPFWDISLDLGNIDHSNGRSSSGASAASTPDPTPPGNTLQ